MHAHICIREYRNEDLEALRAVWNEVVADGRAFPQHELLTPETARAFFAAQSFTAAAECNGAVAGLYVLHPNNVGRCGHLANASYAVASGARGLGVGEALVRHSLDKGRELGFRVLQFNAVVASNTAARRLYAKLGFTALGTVPGGFLNRDGVYEDIVPMYRVL